jgi:hypothetical protein
MDPWIPSARGRRIAKAAIPFGAVPDREPTSRLSGKPEIGWRQLVPGKYVGTLLSVRPARDAKCSIRGL